MLFLQICFNQLSSPEGIKFSPWNVMSRHPSGHLVPLQLKRHKVWGWFCSTNFQGLNFISSGELSWSICFWVICQWNKFEEKAQCDTYLALTSSLSLLTFVIRYTQHAALLAPPWFLKRCNKENIFLSSSSLYFWLSLLHSILVIFFSSPYYIFSICFCIF